MQTARVAGTNSGNLFTTLLCEENRNHLLSPWGYMHNIWIGIPRAYNAVLSSHEEASRSADDCRR